MNFEALALNDVPYLSSNGSCDPEEARKVDEMTGSDSSSGPVSIPEPLSRTNITPPEGLDEELDLDDIPTLNIDDLDPVFPLLGNRGVTSHAHTSTLARPGTVPGGELWQTHRHYRDSLVARLREVGRDDLSEPLARCHEEPVFARCTNCRKVQMFTKRCDRHYCPLCQPSLTLKRMESVAWWARQIDEPKHIILTVRNIPDLRTEHFAELKRWLAALRRNVIARKKTFWRIENSTGSFKRETKWKPPTATHHTKTSWPWKGGFYSIQVTNTGEGWHPHIHILVDCRYTFLPALQAAWLKTNRGAGDNIRVLDCRDDTRLREVVRYVSKPSSVARWSGSVIAQFVDALDGVRCFGVFGTLFGKRTEWREFLETLRYSRPECSCGCSSWQFFGEDEWAAEQLRIEIALRPATGPPETQRADPQLQFASN